MFWQVGRDAGTGESLPVAVAGIGPCFSGRFLGKNMKISLQGSSTKEHVMFAAVCVILLNEKGIPEHSDFPPHILCAYEAKLHLLLFVSTAVEYFQSHKAIAGLLARAGHLNKAPV